MILRPDEWVGRRLPLFELAKLPGEVESGEWIVILHSRTCDHCREILPELLNQTRDISVTDSSLVRFALIDIQPGEAMEVDWPNVVSRSLPASHEWFVSPPVALRIRDEMVVGVCLDKQKLPQFVQGNEGDSQQTHLHLSTVGTVGGSL